jgi:hypothetical protein
MDYTCQTYTLTIGTKKEISLKARHFPMIRVLVRRVSPKRFARTFPFQFLKDCFGILAKVRNLIRQQQEGGRHNQSPIRNRSAALTP